MELRISIDCSDPPGGAITSGLEDEPPVQFSGWLELLGVLDHLLQGEGRPRKV